MRKLLVSSALWSDQWLWYCRHKYLQFWEFEILWHVYSPPLMCSNYSQPGLWNPVLDRFNALNLIVPSSLRSGQWLQCCKHKYLQFSEFEIPQQLHSPPLMCFKYSQPGLWNHDEAYLMRRISPCHLPCDLVNGCSAASTNIFNFRNLRSCESYIHHLWCASTTVSQVFGTMYWTYLMCWISSCHPPCDLVNGCSAASTNTVRGMWKSPPPNLR